MAESLCTRVSVHVGQIQACDFSQYTLSCCAQGCVRVSEGPVVKCGCVHDVTSVILQDCQRICVSRRLVVSLTAVISFVCATELMLHGCTCVLDVSETQRRVSAPCSGAGWLSAVGLLLHVCGHLDSSPGGIPQYQV